MTVAVTGDRLITTSWFDNAVKVWDPRTDQAVASWTELKRPVYARAFQGDVVVSEWDTGSVLRLEMAEPEKRTAIATGIATPAGLAAGPDDLYVADRDAGRVVQIVDGGNVLSPVREVARGLAGPEGIELAEDGSLYVVEAEADRLSRIDPETGETTLVADGLALQVAPAGRLPHHHAVQRARGRRRSHLRDGRPRERHLLDRARAGHRCEEVTPLTARRSAASGGHASATEF